MWVDDIEMTDEEFIAHLERQAETLPPDSLTEEQRAEMAKDFEKDDIHKIIGNNSNIAKVVEKYNLTPDEARRYRECIDWPKASKRQMREMEEAVRIHKATVDNNVHKTYLADAVDRELEGDDEEPELLNIKEYVPPENEDDIEWIEEWIGDRILKKDGEDT